MCIYQVRIDMKTIIDKLEHAVYLIEDPYTIGVLREAIEAIEKLRNNVTVPCLGCTDMRRFHRNYLLEENV